MLLSLQFGSLSSVERPVDLKRDGNANLALGHAGSFELMADQHALLRRKIFLPCALLT